MAELPTALPLLRVRFVALCAALAVAVLAMPAHAQFSTSPQQPGVPTSKNKSPLSFPTAPPPTPRAKLPQKNGKDQMLVQARRIDYDYNNRRVSAVGNVQIYYAGSTLEADKVVYDEKTKRLRAEGNARLTDQSGNVTYGQVMDLSDDYRDGFVDSLHLELADRTSVAAARASRTGGNFSVFDSAVYTACLPCRDNPKKPPLWQVKAARIIHDQTEKMIYFEDAQIEFFGQPIAYIPYFSAPDPTVKRKTGFLMPNATTTTVYGGGLEIPYYIALAPNYDATFAPVITTRQGPLLQGEFRERTIDGSYAIRAAGIYQLDRGAFDTGAPGDRNFRGSIESSGKFALNDKWVWGWDAIAMTDRAFLQDYRPRLSAYSRGFDTSQVGMSGSTEAESNIFLTGRGDRSFFDIRSIYYEGFSNQDNQTQLPVIHPVLDYDYILKNPVLGGELSFKTNLTSLSRQNAEFDQFKFDAASGCGAGANPAANANCFLMRGIPGEYDRLSTKMEWRKSITDPAGEVWTPFAYVRLDAASTSITSQPGVSNYIATGNSGLGRAMPAVGLEYRYPFISVQSWGTQTIEPIAQIIARPNETQIGRFPNEDAQSFSFDDSNLFAVDKFSGWDRVEGGGRANVGVQYTAQFNQGGSLNGLFGQSYQLFGKNSFATQSPTDTGIDSGLDSSVSDYVARLQFQPNKTFVFTTRYRFDHETMNVNRLEVEAQALYDRWTLAVTYGNYAAQPEIGIFSRQQGVLGRASYKLDANWVTYGNALYDIDSGKFVQAGLGLGYVDDCFILSLNYLYGYSYDVPGSAVGPSTSVPQPKISNAIMLQIGLRTLGEAGFSQSVGTSNQ
jgi:LPS-assembly protein